MEMAYPDLLLAKMQAPETRGMHSALDPRQVVGILSQQFPASAQGFKQQFVVREMFFMLSAGNLCVGQTNEIEEIEEHPIRIRRVGAVPKKPGASPEYIEGYIREDAVMEIINELRVIQLRKINSHGWALDFANRPGNGGPHIKGRARKTISINSRCSQEAIPDCLGHISMLRMTGARHSQG